MLDTLAKATFVLASLLFAYHHFAYPWLLHRLAERRGGAKHTGTRPTVLPLDENTLPSVTIIVPAYNEEQHIAGKVHNLANIDYPRDRLRIIIALDGCTDNTTTEARTALDELGNPSHFMLQDHGDNRGKLAMLNEHIAAASTDIVALSDVSAAVDPNILRAAAVHFLDEDVGVICPTYRLKFPSNQGERKYWQYQTRVKSFEAAVAAPMGAHGAFYLFRRPLWQPLPEATVNDDFVLPMRIVAAGYRAVYDEAIVAWELERTRPEQEFVRRVRIGRGNMQQLVMFNGLLNPWRRPREAAAVPVASLAFVFASGKALRVLMPFVMIAGALACLYLAFTGYGLFASIAISGTIVTGIGGWAILNRSPRTPKIIAWLSYLLEGHLANLIGAANYLTGRAPVSWSNAPSAGSQSAGHYIPVHVRAAKRAFDTVLSALALVLLWPVFLPIALAVRLESPGPIFYRQRRVGRISAQRAEVFELIKFRTMYEDAEKRSGPQWASEGDPRITRVGLFLRKTRLDELPQFVNVIKGDMSLVGPRPERPQLISNLEANLPLYTERTFGLRPGITGLAQVNQGYDQTIEDVRNKLLFDHAYAAHLSRGINWLTMDLRIMFQTVTVMVTGRGQ